MPQAPAVPWPVNLRRAIQGGQIQCNWPGHPQRVQPVEPRRSKVEMGETHCRATDPPAPRLINDPAPLHREIPRIHAQQAAQLQGIPRRTQPPSQAAGQCPTGPMATRSASGAPGLSLTSARTRPQPGRCPAPPAWADSNLAAKTRAPQTPWFDAPPTTRQGRASRLPGPPVRMATASPCQTVPCDSANSKRPSVNSTTPWANQPSAGANNTTPTNAPSAAPTCPHRLPASRACSPSAQPPAWTRASGW